MSGDGIDFCCAMPRDITLQNMSFWKFIKTWHKRGRECSNCSQNHILWIEFAEFSLPVERLTGDLGGNDRKSRTKRIREAMWRGWGWTWFWRVVVPKMLEGKGAGDKAQLVPCWTVFWPWIDLKSHLQSSSNLTRIFIMFWRKYKDPHSTKTRGTQYT